MPEVNLRAIAAAGDGGEPGEKPGLRGRIGRLGPVAAVTGVAGFLLALLLVFAALIVWQDYRYTSATAELRALQTARAASYQARWLVEASLQAAQRVDDAVGSTLETLSAASAGQLEPLVGSLPADTAIWVFNADGDAVLTHGERVATANVADRPYFQAIRDGQVWRITSLLTERLSGRKGFLVVRRIERQGRFVGAVAVVVAIEALSAFWRALDLGDDSSVGLIRADGWLVARHPVPAAAIDLSGYALFTEYLPRAPAGVYTSPASPADGVSRIVGYARAEGLPLIAVTGVSARVALAPFWRRTSTLALIVVPTVLLFGAAMIWTRRLARRDATTREEMANALAYNRILLREVHHRVKNNLQVAIALVDLQLGDQSAKQNLAGRLKAMATLHEQMYRTDQFGQIDFASIVPPVIDGLKLAFGASASVHYDLKPALIDEAASLPLSLIVSEVVSNVFKHAFQTARDGKVWVGLATGPDGMAELRIRDDGVGLAPEGEGTGTGMGMQLVRDLCGQIAGSCEFHSDDGTTFVLRFATKAPAEWRGNAGDDV